MFIAFLKDNKEVTQILSTDASKTPFMSSIANCSSIRYFVHRVSSINTYITAEILVIGIVLDELFIPSDPLVIMTDKRSSISALEAMRFLSSKIFLWLTNFADFAIDSLREN